MKQRITKRDKMEHRRIYRKKKKKREREMEKEKERKKIKTLKKNQGITE